MGGCPDLLGLERSSVTVYRRRSPIRVVTPATFLEMWLSDEVNITPDHSRCQRPFDQYSQVSDNPSKADNGDFGFTLRGNTESASACSGEGEGGRENSLTALQASHNLRLEVIRG